MLALTPERVTSFEEHANRSGVEARFVDGAEMSRLAPHLDVTRVEGGYLVPDDGYLDPRACALAFCAAAEDPGVGIRVGTAATGCAALGIAGSAAVGRWLADWIAMGDPVAAEPGMVFFLHCVVADSDRGVAMSLGRTYLVTDAARDVFSTQPLELIVV